MEEADRIIDAILDGTKYRKHPERLPHFAHAAEVYDSVLRDSPDNPVTRYFSPFYVHNNLEFVRRMTRRR
ncbi:MAG: hypothetical protein ABIG30_00885 [Candidatus Aenigmatarchaeota archaeon]